MESFQANYCNSVIYDEEKEPEKGNAPMLGDIYLIDQVWHKQDFNLKD